jgi:hypothetical protein
MKKAVALLMIVGFVLSGCGPQRVQTETRMAQLFSADFRDFAVPDVSTIKAGETRAFSNAGYDEVWDAVAVVLMQDSAVIRCSKDSGVMVGLTKPPLAIHVGKDQGTIPVYLYWMTDLYISVDEPKTQLVNFPDLGKKAGEFLDRVSTQLGAGRKWKYLYEG